MHDSDTIFLMEERCEDVEDDAMGGDGAGLGDLNDEKDVVELWEDISLVTWDDVMSKVRSLCYLQKQVAEVCTFIGNGFLTISRSLDPRSCANTYRLLC
jgi:hypothetical protein